MCVQALQDSGVKNVLALAKVSVAYAGSRCSIQKISPMRIMKLLIELVALW